MLNLIETIREHPERFKQLVCKVLLCTQYDCPQQRMLQDLYSEHNFIVYVLSGKRVLYQPGHTYEMTQGKCVFSKKGGWLSQKENGDNWSVIIFFMPDNYLQQFFKKYQQQLPAVTIQKETNRQMINLETNETTRSFFHSMAPYFNQTPPPSEILLELKFRELLLNLLSSPENKELLFHLQCIADHHKQSLTEIIEGNYTYNLSLTEFAKLCHVSLASFKREFKKVFQTTPGKWLMEKRLDYASMLISTTSKSINDISFESGFENTTHFSRVFKEKFHTSPLQYRQQFLEAEISF